MTETFARPLPRRYWAILLLVSLLNVSTYLLHRVDGDIWLYLVRMECFAQQFWQGDPYPRWCFSANDGLGSPVFFFYFPLPFYIAALFYPLTHLGLGMYGLFVLFVFLATWLTALACYDWLKEIVTPGCAVLASILLLFLPYRLEMLFFRGAYAEIWCLALLPLIAKYTRRLALSERRAFLPLSLCIALSLLTHVPATFAMLLFCGVYVLLRAGKDYKSMLAYGISCLFGLALAAFYLIPGWYYQQFLAPVALADGLFGWANGYLTLSYLHTPGLERPALAALLMVLLLLALLAAVYKNRAAMEDVSRREARIWGVIGLMALLLLLPVSAPVYALLGPLSSMLFPWRMQLVISLAMACLLAILMQSSLTKRRTWKTDYVLAVSFFWLCGHAFVASYGPEGQALNERLRARQIVFSREYRTRWTDEAHWDYAYLLTQRIQPQASFVKGEGEAALTRWDWREIALTVHAKETATLRLRHLYFPLWEAADVVLRPEGATGLMLLDVPAGRHSVRLHLHDSILNAAFVLSLAALAAWIYLNMRQKFFDNTRGG